MNWTNENELWSHVLVDELVKNGLRTVCVCPGSRNTPLTIAFNRHEEVTLLSHLDERSASFFALGRGKQTGRPTAVLTTSGTATAECHPAVLEANRARVPLLVLTADRPPELHDSGANQTIDQSNLYGDAVHLSKTLPEPEADGRKLRSLRVTAGTAAHATTNGKPGPVHVNIPFRKPLEPRPNQPTIPTSFLEQHDGVIQGREGPFVHRTGSVAGCDRAKLRQPFEALLDQRRGWIVAGPARYNRADAKAAIRIAERTGFPLLADPQSGVRFHEEVDNLPVLSGYDGYLDVDDEELDSPEIVLRIGANPTATKRVNEYLGQCDARQLLVDPAGEWPEDQFTATDLLETTPSNVADVLETMDVPSAVDVGWKEQWIERDQQFWNRLNSHESVGEGIFEPDVLRKTVDVLPPRGHLFVSNSLPVRDLAQFVRHRPKPLTVHANRGCSGIDGIVSTALGVKHATDQPLVAVVGDLAFYHDMNGLLTLKRHDVNATIVVVNNDGGGIFHRLPIEDHDPPFTDYVKTPHALTFETVGELYDCDYDFVESTDSLGEVLQTHITSNTPAIVEIRTDGEQSERIRERRLPSL